MKYGVESINWSIFCHLSYLISQSSYIRSRQDPNWPKAPWTFKFHRTPYGLVIHIAAPSISMAFVSVGISHSWASQLAHVFHGYCSKGSFFFISVFRQILSLFSEKLRCETILCHPSEIFRLVYINVSKTVIPSK